MAETNDPHPPLTNIKPRLVSLNFNKRASVALHVGASAVPERQYRQRGTVVIFNSEFARPETIVTDRLPSYRAARRPGFSGRHRPGADVEEQSTTPSTCNDI